MKKNSIITLIIGIVIGVLITSVVSFSINSNTTPAPTTTTSNSVVSTTEVQETTEVTTTEIVEKEEEALIWLDTFGKPIPHNSTTIVVNNFEYEKLSDPHEVYIMGKELLNINFLELEPETSWKLIEKELVTPGLVRVVVQSTFPEEEGSDTYVSEQTCDLLYGGRKIAKFYLSEG